MVTKPAKKKVAQPKARQKAVVGKIAAARKDPLTSKKAASVPVFAVTTGRPG
ncbi:MAG: hypothetical protein NT176_13485 [Proteobacteria bacterium]|nr:hypothetical protein [Pseudomonadota bacterium]